MCFTFRYQDKSVDQTILPTSTESEQEANLNPLPWEKNIKDPIYVNELRSVKNISKKFQGTPNKTLFFEFDFKRVSVYLQLFLLLCVLLSYLVLISLSV